MVFRGQKFPFANGSAKRTHAAVQTGPPHPLWISCGLSSGYAQAYTQVIHRLYRRRIGAGGRRMRHPLADQRQPHAITPRHTTAGQCIEATGCPLAVRWLSVGGHWLATGCPMAVPLWVNSVNMSQRGLHGLTPPKPIYRLRIVS